MQPVWITGDAMQAPLLVHTHVIHGPQVTIPPERSAQLESGCGWQMYTNGFC